LCPLSRLVGRRLVPPHPPLFLLQISTLTPAAILVAPITALFWYSAFNYFPSHFSYISRRFSYYVFADESVSFVDAFVEWINLLWVSHTGTVNLSQVATTAAHAVASGAEKVEL
jgi:hypothetical protein